MKILPALAISLAAAATAIGAGPPAHQWEIGPIIRGKSYSVNMPLRPQPTERGWSFDFPSNSKRDGHVHYVSFDPGSLDGAREIKVRYRVDARRGTRFVPQEFPDRPATVSLYFQRAGDNWTAKGRYAMYRWYAPADSIQSIAPGVHEMTVRLDDPRWGAVVGGNASQYPREFAAALANADNVGLVFGSKGGRGHGVYATGPARFELLDFRIR